MCETTSREWFPMINQLTDSLMGRPKGSKNKVKADKKEAAVFNGEGGKEFMVAVYKAGKAPRQFVYVVARNADNALHLVQRDFPNADKYLFRVA